ncbi:MAG TPA: hypothetical protein VG992_01140 [Candidatus Saccharimonadales bacterium]|nr:hypothetical protein [Candidatus Saccharimonadales bacterium]
MGNVGLPEGFQTGRPIPDGFVLHSVLTAGELMNDKYAKAYTDEGQRLRKIYGRGAFQTDMNTGSGWQRDPAAIAVATFRRYDATPLLRTTRARRAASRLLFGLKCDVNF